MKWKEDADRCGWCVGDPLYERYHDEEWGREVTDDRTMFEFLTLESAQAGLSWITILRRRENYRKAFAGFDPEKVAAVLRRKDAVAASTLMRGILFGEGEE